MTVNSLQKSKAPRWFERVFTPSHNIQTVPAQWQWSVWLIAAIVLLPIIAVLWLTFFPEENIWPHLLDTVLPNYLSSTLLLMLGVGLLSSWIGISTAWVSTMYDFPGRRIFEWALLLPFAVPAYVIAYVYTDMLEYSGWVQTGLRGLFGWESARDYWFPHIRSLGGAILMLSLVLYPYIFMMVRATFIEQSASLRDAARTLGCNRREVFWRVSLPTARPALAVGLALVLMETLNDFGTVDYFAVRTLTAGIYDVWMNMGNIGGAAQIASVMMIFILVLIGFERYSRRRQKQFSRGDSFKTFQRVRLKGRKALACWLICALPLLLGFIVPVAALFRHAVVYFEDSWTTDFFHMSWNSFMLSSIAAICTIILGLILAYGNRLVKRGSVQKAVRLAGLGYAMPGAVLAVGVIMPLAAFDNAVDHLAREWLGVSTGLLLSGTLFAIIFAYIVRFLAVASGSIESSLEKVTPSMDMAARSLGYSTAEILRKVHLPMIKPGVLTAALVVFVDCMKELPATLVLRPFNFDTLATHVYQYASDEMLEASALAALVIVLVGIVPVILLSRSIIASRNEMVSVKPDSD
ncbi:iron(III) transport system permease protein [Oceanospirillum multiglobuliferum]|uniref:Iron ABC transporter permease n=1 Tax=Oceanospirillum multiglobuliferum TaxID=64969 RepID=A0A1T4RP51_9GAMM|nr:iron ABC transporter permease [Oceanospirillum multiglobuliferum]OPX54658.1 iron ABC transporter permease [Oceanospirillum multiglobuliferum]SKA17754.1 iron(III) transport system permease protein [Oceanospirillum multiglobuliferum]